MTRPTRAQIILSALDKNIKLARTKIAQAGRPGAKTICVVKADAYGHGAKKVAKRLEQNGADALAVACLEEAADLKEAGIGCPIIVLGPIQSPEIKHMASLGIMPVISKIEDIKIIESELKGMGSDKKITAALEVDTGMGRMGLMPEQMPRAMDELEKSGKIELKGLFSHLPCSESETDEDRKYTENQIHDFELLWGAVKKRFSELEYVSIANSAAVMNYPGSVMTAIRPGIMLYGVCPACGMKEEAELEPVMRWTTDIVQIRDMPAGSCVSYGRETVLGRRSRIAVLPVGYADGLMRRIRPGFGFYVNGMKAPLVGVITMDLVMIDVTDISNVKLGDRALIMGRDKQMSLQGEVTVTVSAETHARQAGTIAYEILTSVGKRVKREYVEI